MKSLLYLSLAMVIILTTPAFALTPYSQDFEAMIITDPIALSNDGWLVYGNVFDAGFNHLYGYGLYPAPNNHLSFSQIVLFEGDAGQGLQQLLVFSDYENADHAVGNWVESNVLQEQQIAATDVDKSFTFSFQAKRGNIEGTTTAKAFIKTLDPGNNWATTNFLSLDMTTISTSWSDFSISIYIDPTLSGQFLQFGFVSTATLYAGSGVIYDNIQFDQDGPVATEERTWGSLKSLFR
jgi:hypothetical protein